MSNEHPAAVELEEQIAELREEIDMVRDVVMLLLRAVFNV